VSNIDLLITYLAVGSAFAMRSYFLNRRRPILVIARSVLVELLLWLPVWGVRAAKGLFSRMQSYASHQRSANDPAYESYINDVLCLVYSRVARNRIREGLEKYTALHLALEAGTRQPGGQFELFEISGHRNGSTGTSCLYRKNLAKLHRHKRSTADDLIELVASASQPAIPNSTTASKLSALFELVGDAPSVAKAQRRFEGSEKYLPAAQSPGESAVVTAEPVFAPAATGTESIYP
jgi:hypothetical protein